MKKGIFSLFSMLVLGFSAIGQQEQQHTQFMYVLQAFNPGAAGSMGAATATVLYRNQWQGIEGAPQTMGVLAQGVALNGRVGWGANALRRTVGISDRYTLDGQYSYRVELGRGFLSGGLQVSVRHFRNNFLDDRLKGSTDISQDMALPQDQMSRTVPNFGAGVFYHGQRWYAGISVPRLVSNNIDHAQLGVISRETSHFYAMGGMDFPLGEELSVRPQVLLKYVAGAPFDADINATLTAKKKFRAGVTYRTGSGETSKFGESLDFLLGMQAHGRLFVGLSYDLGLSKLRSYNNGSFEAIVRVALRPVSEEGEVLNPRDFTGGKQSAVLKF